MLSADRPLVLLGAGNMGGAMLGGWLAMGLDPGAVIVVDPRPSEERLAQLAKAGVRHRASLPGDVTAGIFIVAVKPQILEAALSPAASLVDQETVVVSIVAGKTIATLEALLGPLAVVRAMPNTPALVGRGITGCFANDRVSVAMRGEIERLLSTTGPVVWVEEETQIDAVTAVSGSGPAYVFYMVECMAEAARKCGLPAEVAMQLARATVAGAGELLHRAPEEASRLRANVTSPNGTTAAALSVLMAEDGLQPLMDRALMAANVRAGELAG